jgi:hypothetical protein
MNNRLLVIGLGITILFALVTAILVLALPKPKVNNANDQTLNIAATNTSTKAKMYLVKLNDDGLNGIKVGCGDSLVFIERFTPSGSSALITNLQALLNLKTQIEPNTSYYNAVYQSSLHIDSATIDNGLAEVRLSGTVQLGGVCDDPRFTEQLRQTVLNSPGVMTADITINGQTLEQITSGR